MIPDTISLEDCRSRKVEVIRRDPWENRKLVRSS